MNILAHRGYWLKPEEKNTRIAFERALSLGFGIESDVRDYLGNLVISHDIPGDSAMPLSEFIALLEQYPRVSFALNVKSDGLQLGIKNSRLSLEGLINVYIVSVYSKLFSRCFPPWVNSKSVRYYCSVNFLSCCMVK